MALSVGLVFETREEIVRKLGARATEDVAYHWRESEEIDAVTAALQACGARVHALGPIRSLLERPSIARELDLVWNLSVGALSRNRTALAPAVLEELGVRYVGADASAKSLVLNKHFLKPLLRAEGIATPDWRVFHRAEEVTGRPPWDALVVKPACEGNSLGLRVLARADGVEALRDAVAGVVGSFGCPALCEALVVGREMTLGLLEGADAFGAVETRTADGDPLGDRVLDTAVKRRGGLSRVAIGDDDEALARALEASRKLAALFGSYGYASFDFRVDGSGTPFLVDVNLDATLHPARSFALGLALRQVPYARAIALILERAEQRYSLRPELGGKRVDELRR